MTTSQLRVGGGAWIKGKESMKMSEIQQVMDSFEDNSVLKTKDKPENLQDLIAVSGKLKHILGQRDKTKRASILRNSASSGFPSHQFRDIKAQRKG